MTNEIKVDGVTTSEDIKEETKAETEVKPEAKPDETTEEPVALEETKDAKQARITGSLKRMAKDLEDMGVDPSSILGIKAEKTIKTSKKSNDLDTGDKAFLMQTGVKLDELEFAQGIMKKTGLSIEEFAADDYAQAKLKSFREARTTAQAIPSGTRRSSPQTKDSVDYHLEKYENGSMKLNEMPFEMREKVLQAKMKKEENSSKFTFAPSV